VVAVGIDPGHGGRDPGAVGKKLGLREKDVNLEVGLELAQYLKENGVKTVLSRSKDVDVELRDRSELFNREDVNLVVSIHVNSATSSRPNYLVTFIFTTGGKTEELAELVQDELRIVTGWPSGGVRAGNFYMLRETKMPAILTELGFISNPEQEEFLAKKDNRKLLAGAIGRGILKYLGLFEKLDQPSTWAREAWTKAARRGIVDGTRPQETATRQEVVVILDRLGLLD